MSGEMLVTDAHGWPLDVQGPTAIPFRNMAGKEEGHPHHPGLHGRYSAIDLDANNRASVDAARAAWKERHPDGPPFPKPHLGWGVCRQGFGLQNLPRMDEAEAVAKGQGNEREHAGRPGWNRRCDMPRSLSYVLKDIETTLEVERARRLDSVQEAEEDGKAHHSRAVADRMRADHLERLRAELGEVMAPDGGGYTLTVKALYPDGTEGEVLGTAKGATLYRVLAVMGATIAADHWPPSSLAEAEHMQAEPDAFDLTLTWNNASKDGDSEG